MQLRVFRLGLPEDRNAGVGVFPEREEILIGDLRLSFLSRQDKRSAELQVRKGAYGIGYNDSGVIEKLLKLRGGFGALVQGNIRRAMHVNRIKCPIGSTNLNLGAINEVNGTIYAFNDGTNQAVTLDLANSHTSFVSNFDPAAGREYQ